MASQLSAEERAVLCLSARGLSSDEIADRLGVTVADVRRELAGAMWALSARTKLEAIVAAVRLGLIELERRVPEAT